MSLLNEVYMLTELFLNEKSKQERKKIGQFFTSPKTAKFMGSLLNYDKAEINILDPGAGSGILTCALCERMLEDNTITTINVDLYENNEDVLALLYRNMEFITTRMQDANIKFTYRIIKENFIVFNAGYWRGEFCPSSSDYDVVIANPPYKKIGKSEIESISMIDIVHGQPNIYFLFMAMSAKLLKEDGQLIFIVPRSFSSGAYFKEFRKWFFKYVKLTNLHLFVSRDDVFKNEDVLQETIILKAIKTSHVIDFVTISESENTDFINVTEFEIPYNMIIKSDENMFMLIPTREQHIKVLNFFSKWENNLITLGFRLKTGPVVDFRSKEALKEKYDAGKTVPLFWAYNFSNNHLKFPIQVNEKPQFILSEFENLLVENLKYLFVKRFTSKEEKRRVQVVLYEKEEFDFTKIGIENHLNYITKIRGEMTKEEQYGLYILFNSSYIDYYYRILNGSTQVNANEINTIPLPNYKDIVDMGKKLILLNNFDTVCCDSILEDKYVKGGYDMGKLNEAQTILRLVGMPKQQYNERSAYVLLALAGLKEEDSWQVSTNNALRIVDMMNFMAENYGKIYKPNSRETIRKETIHQFCDGVIAERNIDDNERATNSPNYSYRLTFEALELICSYGTEEWEDKLENFLSNKDSLSKQYEQVREMTKLPIKINQQVLNFSPGKHNELQKAIIEEFVPRFAHNAEILYVGDTEKKDLIKNLEKLNELGIMITPHDKLPDVILYREDKDWLYFIEAVTSVGPVSVKRMNEIQVMLNNCKCGLVYVTAFLDMTAKNGFKKFIEHIAWETEIWVADQPDHMIHMNGDRFLGPRY